jgi:TRAP-type mannitol/chloroaromatic compound transport system permease small subunit
VFMRVIRKLDHWIGRISQYLMLVTGILVLLMAFLATYGVLRRYAFGSPEPYSYELSTICLLWSGVLAVAGVEWLDRNVRNDLISSRFPQAIRVIILGFIGPLLAFLFCAVLSWKSMENALYALEIGQVTASPWALPLAPIKFVIPLGYILLCLVLLSKICHGFILVKNIGQKREDIHPPPPSPI